MGVVKTVFGEGQLAVLWAKTFWYKILGLYIPKFGCCSFMLESYRGVDFPQNPFVSAAPPHVSSGRVPMTPSDWGTPLPGAGTARGWLKIRLRNGRRILDLFESFRDFLLLDVLALVVLVWVGCFGILLTNIGDLPSKDLTSHCKSQKSPCLVPDFRR